MFNGRRPFIKLLIHEISEQVTKGEINPMQESLRDESVPRDLEIFFNACFEL